MENIPATDLQRSNSWYYEVGYLTMDLELFGKYLSALFSKYLGKDYYFQTFTPTIKTDKDRPIWQQGEETKYLAIIGPKLYSEDPNKNYSRVREVDIPFSRPHYMSTSTMYSKEYPSMFYYAPLELDEKEFLLYFGNTPCEKVKINLGHVDDGQFVPTNSFKVKPKNEVKHSNLPYLFVEDFIRAIFTYKILNKKPVLDESDMELILEEFGISRETKLQELTGIFKSIQKESTEILLSSNNVGNILRFKKSNNTINNK